ncbi:uncharacterized protein LOC118781114 isoform X2 [Megalops cyprinoides]|uniref:uncharacterized protein LOC118781114 isoform X2 n=1 Tax=Megalops cyprinoides TaxID=118141 RepID=UPI001864FDB9|nr:uncharacterized protein LOC118781114 isoform X2 [Megalops cyprinoides]
MRVDRIVNIFQVNTTSLYITDASNVVIFPMNNGCFSTMDLTDKAQYEVHGETVGQSPALPMPAPAPSPSQPFAFRWNSQPNMSQLARSVSTQRSFQRSQFWMELFADLRDSGHFNGSHVHQCLLRFCYGDVIQKDLDECVRQWNSHRIHTSRTASCPGVPNELFYLPHRFGSRDCGFEIEEAELDAFPEARLSIPKCGDQNMQEYLEFAMESNQLHKPENWEAATELYMKLKEIVQL